jgi:hypothetical protein
MRIICVTIFLLVPAIRCPLLLAHGEPLDLSVGQDRTLATNEAVYASTFDLVDGQVLTTRIPGFGVESANNGLRHEATIGIDVLEPLRFWDGTSFGPTAASLLVENPLGDVTYTVTADSGVQSGMTLGTYDGSPHWDVHADFTLLPATADRGVYGLVLSMTSPSHLPSAPFFIAFNNGLSDEDFDSALEALEADFEGRSHHELLAGDANQDLAFDQLDLIQVQQAAKYLTGQPATWGQGDWNGAPGGRVGMPPVGDGLFNQLDIVAALGAGTYLSGPYAAIIKGGHRGDAQTSIVYDAGTGELAVDAPAGQQLTSLNIDSAAGVFTGDAAANLGGSFDNDADNNIFKATFGSSFGSLSFGNVAQSGLSEQFVLNDLAAVGSLAGGGDLGNVDLIYIPEPAGAALLAVGIVALSLAMRWRRC